MEAQSWEETEIIEAKLLISPMEKLRLRERKGFAQNVSMAELGLIALSLDYRFRVLYTTVAGIETWALNKPDLEATQIWREMAFPFSILKLARSRNWADPVFVAKFRENAKAPASRPLRLQGHPGSGSLCLPSFPPWRQGPTMTPCFIPNADVLRCGQLAFWAALPWGLGLRTCRIILQGGPG